MKKNIPVVLPLFLSLLLASCASVAHYSAIDNEVSTGNYPGAYAKVQASKDKYRNIDYVLYKLDAGLLAHYAGAWSDSSKLLTDAERGIESAFTKSVTREASSYLVNDNTKEYAGDDYEDVYLNVFNALNYYHKGSIEDAFVEIRRVDNKLKFIATKYNRAISNAQQATLEKSPGIPYDPEQATVKFTNSALARYLSMIMYRSQGEDDDARIDRDKVKLAFADQPSVYAFPLPTSLDDELAVPRGKARLNVMCFYGPAPIKNENTTRIPIGPGNWIKIALPVITQRPTAVARVEVTLDSGQTFTVEKIEDLGAVAAETFKQKASFIYFKTIMRSVAKTSSSVLLEKGAKKANDSGAGLLLSVLSVGAQVYAEASEQADLRISHYFPSKAAVGGITLDPGTYSFTVRYYNASNGLVHEERFQNVTVAAGGLNLTEAICIK
ncbi:MAG TPA: hypothetical protein PK542_00100 [Treponemataceae bacterium]|nr:hypothetical protein [Treponemataceae bacterium]HPS42869.1 hypothetical protein [Treponemataceae bacterium]